MNRLAILLLFAFFIVSCKSKKKNNDAPAENFIVNDYIKGQVAKLDTSLYSFKKIEIIGDKSDTVSIKNSDVRQYAKDFLELPDLSKEEIREDYTISHLYDDLQNAFIFQYATTEDHPIREEQVTVEPEINKEGKNDIRSVYVNYVSNNISKKMMWEANHFYITTITEVPSQPQQIKTVKIIWNGFDGETK